jgi:anti-anti-sigma factor
MRLTLQSQLMDDVVVIRCQGRITLGAEVDALEAELEKQTKIPGTDSRVVKQVVLQLAGADCIDSSGLGALVRMFGVLRANGGALNLMRVVPIRTPCFSDHEPAKPNSDLRFGERSHRSIFQCVAGARRTIGIGKN